MKAFIPFLFVVVLAVAAYGASEGPNNPLLAVDNASVGTVVWTNPNNIYVSDNLYASIFTSYESVYTHYLKATNFSFSIPTGATINGIFVGIEYNANRNSGVDYTIDSEVKIMKNGVISATNRSDSVNKWPTVDTNKTYGNSTDLWGEDWTAEDINSNGFGIVVSAYSTSGEEDVYSSIDNVRITVNYTGGVTDTCTPPASGNYAVNAADNCQWLTNSDIPGNVTINGTGKTSLYGNWTFTGLGNSIAVFSGAEFAIFSGGRINGR